MPRATEDSGPPLPWGAFKALSRLDIWFEKRLRQPCYLTYPVWESQRNH